MQMQVTIVEFCIREMIRRGATILTLLIEAGC